MQLDLTNEKERKKTFPGYEKTEVPLPYPITPVNIYPIPFHAHEWLSDDGGQTEYRQKSRANRVEEIEIEAVEAEIEAETAKIGAAAAENEAAAEIGAIFSVNSDHRTGCPYQCRCPHFLSRASVLDGGEASSPSEQNHGLWFAHGHAAKSLSRTEAMPDRILVASSGQRHQTSSKSRRWAPPPPSRGPRGPHRAAGLLGCWAGGAR
jgi:hypothetical protein